MVWLAALALILAFAAVLAGTVLVARMCTWAVRHHRERQQWDDLVARHRELDRELENIWQRR